MILERCARSFGDFKTCRRKNPMNVTEALVRVVSKGARDGRLVSGMMEIAETLKRLSHSKVMFCAVEIRRVEDIQMKLLEAFCTEHNIKLIKVDNCHNLFRSGGFCDVTAVTNGTGENESHIPTSGQTDVCTCALNTDNLADTMRENNAEVESKVTCLLLTRPTRMSSEEEFVLSYYNTFRKFRNNDYPLLIIPDQCNDQRLVIGH